jgi:formylmethanofuran dehydrogenase subunit B
MTSGRIALAHPLAALASDLPKALYGVAVYDPSELGDLGVEMLHAMAAELSTITRFFTLPLPGSSQGRSAVQVSAWLTGTAPRVGLGRGHPEHDPWRFDGARQVAEGEADAVLWLAPLPTPLPRWAEKHVSVAIVSAGERPEAQVTIEVGVPGTSHGAVLWDDRLATLAYVPPAAAAELPTASSVLAGIEQAIVARRDA